MILLVHIRTMMSFMELVFLHGIGKISKLISVLFVLHLHVASMVHQ